MAFLDLTGLTRFKGKIVDFINNKVNTHFIGTFTNLTTLKSDLLAYARTLEMTDHKVVMIGTNSNIGSGFSAGKYYQGILHILYKNDQGALAFTIIFESESSEEPPIYVNYQDPTWTFDTLTLNSKLTRKTITITPATGITWTWKYANEVAGIVQIMADITGVSISAWGTLDVGSVNTTFGNTVYVPAITVNKAGNVRAEISTNGTITLRNWCDTAVNDIEVVFYAVVFK